MKKITVSKKPVFGALILSFFPCGSPPIQGKMILNSDAWKLKRQILKIISLGAHIQSADLGKKSYR